MSYYFLGKAVNYLGKKLVEKAVDKAVSGTGTALNEQTDLSNKAMDLTGTIVKRARSAVSGQRPPQGQGQRQNKKKPPTGKTLLGTSMAAKSKDLGAREQEVAEFGKQFEEPIKPNDFIAPKGEIQPEAAQSEESVVSGAATLLKRVPDVARAALQNGIQQLTPKTHRSYAFTNLTLLRIPFAIF